jgi:TonB-linked SusC/RagA family outer membrane protein
VTLLFLSGLSLAQAQNREITGKVFNTTTREAVPYATIAVVGGIQAAQGNPQGEFRIVAPAGAVTLSARAIGFKRGQVRVPENETSVEFALERDVLRLEAVVVTGQATTGESRNSASPVRSISSDQLSQVPAQSPEQALQGKVPGALINMNSGAPGGGGQMQIRGVTTILGNGQPLYVVDGVVISNEQVQPGTNSITAAGNRNVSTGIASNQDNGTNRLSDFVTSDMESVQVLEGAAASVLYGSRATNGVVIITTKRGRPGETQFHITQRFGRYDAIRLPGSRIFPNKAAAFSAVYYNVQDSARTKKLVDSAYALNANPFFDYQGALYGQHSLSYETALTVGGGSEGARYFLSGGVKKDYGTMINTSAQRQSLRLNTDFTLGSRVTLGVGAAVMRSINDRGLSNNDNTFTSPYYAFAYTPAILDLQHPDANGNYPQNPFPGGGGNQASNPFQTMASLTNREDIWRQFASANLKWTAFTSERHRLELSVTGGIDHFNEDNQVYSPNFLQYESPVATDGFSGHAVQGQADSRLMNGSVNAVWTFMPSALPLRATTSVGVQGGEQNANTYRVQARGLVPGVGIVNQGTIQTFQQKALIRDEAIYGQEEVVAFNERLLVSVGFHADRSSADGDQNHFFFYPKAGASYRFVAPLPHVDEVKLRGTLGQSGNRPNYGNRDLVLQGNGRAGGLNGIGAPGSIGNPNIEPERMTEQEYGLDAQFFDQRLAIEGTYFKRRITKLLLTAPLAPSSGYTNQIINGGELESKGWELGLRANPLRGWQGLNDVFRATFYKVNQTVIGLPVPNFIVPSSGFGTAYGRSRIATGVSTTAIWGNAPIGIGGARRDTIIGDATPDFQMQFTNDLTWKAFTLSALVDWRQGGQVSDMTKNLFDEGRVSRDYDLPSPDPTIGATLGAYRYNKWGGGRDARLYIEDGTFVKVRELTLSYALPQQVVSSVFGNRVRGARVSVSGRNLLVWSHYWGSDPEVNNFGNQNVSRIVDLAPYPANRSFFFNVDVEF